MIGIYKITSPSGKIYIGQSTNIHEREKHYKRITPVKGQTKIFNSLNKHGWDKHIFEIIEECSIDKLDERETYWKQHYLNQVEYDWNKVLFLGIYDSGGGPKEQHTKDKMSLNIKKVKQLMTDERRQEIGIKISQSHNNMTDEEKQIWGEKISQSHNNMTDEKKQNWGNKIREKKTGHGCYSNPERGKKITNKLNKKVYQYDKNGNLIKEWESITQATLELKYSAGIISMVCNGKIKTAGGFIWKFK